MVLAASPLLLCHFMAEEEGETAEYYIFLDKFCLK